MLTCCLQFPKQRSPHPALLRFLKKVMRRMRHDLNVFMSRRNVMTVSSPIMRARNIDTRSCVACRRLKRRCSKTVPSCSLCERVGRICEYPKDVAAHSALSNQAAVSGLRTNSLNQLIPGIASLNSISLLAVSIAGLGTTSSNTIAAQFLDSVASRGSILQRISLRWSDIVEYPPLSNGKAETILTDYRDGVHQWLPIVSIMKLSRALLDGKDLIDADLNAMVYAMDLIERPIDLVQYSVIKTVLGALLSAGQVSTFALTAEILIAYFEVGQGLFPDAYHSTAKCARICYSLGLHDKRKATQLLEKAESWTEVETRRRLWWSVLVLDRYIHIGFRFRPLITTTIPSDEIIPARDGDWDRGQISVNPLLVMSIEAAVVVSPFARVCQAAHLLGRVIEHVNEHPSSIDVDFHLQEAAQLHRAVKSLVLLCENASELAICYSALMLLYDVHSCVEVDEIEACGGNRGLRVELQQMAIDGYKEVTSWICDLAGTLDSVGQNVSFLVIQCLYSAASTFAWYYRESGNENDMEMLNDLRGAILKLKDHWHVAKTYLDMLEGTEFAYTGGCSQ